MDYNDGVRPMLYLYTYKKSEETVVLTSFLWTLTCIHYAKLLNSYFWFFELQSFGLNLSIARGLSFDVTQLTK